MRSAYGSVPTTSRLKQSFGLVQAGRSALDDAGVVAHAALATRSAETATRRAWVKFCPRSTLIRSSTSTIQIETKTGRDCEIVLSAELPSPAFGGLRYSCVMEDLEAVDTARGAPDSQCWRWPRRAAFYRLRSALRSVRLARQSACAGTCANAEPISTSSFNRMKRLDVPRIAISGALHCDREPDEEGRPYSGEVSPSGQPRWRLPRRERWRLRCAGRR
jgi:hypothetical protein